MKKHFNKTIALILLIAVFFIRFYMLTEKPPHHDESINGWFVVQMWKIGFFRYDPTNYHGPLLFYLFQLSEFFFGKGIFPFRFVTALFSALTVGIFLDKGLKKNWIWFLPAFVLMLSPGAEFFGRSAIHESVLTFFITILLISLSDWRKNKIVIAISLACCLCLKETTVLIIASIFLSCVICYFSEIKELIQQKEIRERLYQIGSLWSDCKNSIYIFFGIMIVFFTGFFQNWHGVLDFFIAFLPWFKTGVAENGHNKPIWFWLGMIFNHERGTFVLLIISSIGLIQNKVKNRFFALVAFIHLAIMSLIPYKTPWCLLSIQIPFVVSAGFVIESATSKFRKIVAVLLIAAATFGLPELYNISYQHPIDMKHQFVYVQTQYAFKDVINYIEINKSHILPERILVGTQESWPLPWWLQDFRLDFTSTFDERLKSYKIIFVDASKKEQAKAILGNSYWEHSFQTRDSREDAVIFIEQDFKNSLRGEL